MCVHKQNPVVACVCSPMGLSLLELVIAVAIVGILSAIATYSFITINEKAYITVARYDARRFFDAQRQYYGDYDVFLGEQGDVISGNPSIASTITLQWFNPSDNVVIEIVSSETENEPFTVEVRLRTVKILYEFNRSISDFELIEVESY